MRTSANGSASSIGMPCTRARAHDAGRQWNRHLITRREIGRQLDPAIVAMSRYDGWPYNRVRIVKSPMLRNVTDDASLLTTSSRGNNGTIRVAAGASYGCAVPFNTPRYPAMVCSIVQCDSSHSR